MLIYNNINIDNRCVFIDHNNSTLLPILFSLH